MSEIPLDELMAAIGTSVNEAQRIIEEQAAAQYCNYFTGGDTAKKSTTEGADEEDGDDDPPPPAPLTPELMRFAVPTPDGKQVHKEVSVPNVTMMTHETLGLDAVRVSLAITSCRMVKGKLKVEVDGQGRAARAEAPAEEDTATAKKKPDPFVIAPPGCQYPFGGRCGSAIEMVFRHAPPAEGIRRLNLEQVKII